MVAQAALETGWLEHPTKDKKTGRDSYNLFNIKARGEQDHVIINTHEYVNGKRVDVEAKFRAYKSYAEAFGDYALLLCRNTRYAKAMKCVSDPYKFAETLQSCGYATDPEYATKIKSIIKKHMEG
jgi:flagellar protein FlgJ